MCGFPLSLSDREKFAKETSEKILTLIRESLPAEKEIVRHRDHDKLIREYEGWNKYRTEMLELLGGER